MVCKDAAQQPIEGFSLESGLTEQQAREIYARGEEAVVFVLLQLAQMLSQQKAPMPVTGGAEDPSCPSGQKLVFTKPNKKEGQGKR